MKEGNTMKDEGIMEIRTIRHHISEEFTHNIREYIAYLQSLEQQYEVQIRSAEQIIQKPKEEAIRLRKAA